jgi:competence protein ComEA
MSGSSGSGGASAAGSAAGGKAGSAGASGAAGSSAAGSPDDDGVLEGGGCACRTTAPASSQAPLGALVSILTVLGAAVARRRRR